MTQKTTFITEEKFAHRLTQLLNESNQDLGHNVTERLRFARDRAAQLQKLSAIEIASAPSLQIQANQSVVLHDGNGSGFNFDFLGKWASLIPLLALVAGLVTIDRLHSDTRAVEVARIDAALLTDDLPPSAYADQGFGLFLRLQLPAAGK